MKTIFRIRMISCLTAAAAIGISVPAFAQQSDSLPMRPANWPEFPPPPPPSTNNTPPVQTGTMPTTANLPAFAGLGQDSRAPAPTASPAPNATLAVPSTSGDNAPSRVWNVGPSDGSAPSQSTQPMSPMERSPREFGNGWRNFVSQKVLGRETPAAVLSAPRPASAGPRPDWSWHGYDSYNQGRPNEQDQSVPTGSEANAADMAPFMKYAHLWRPSNFNATTGAMQGLAQSFAAPTNVTSNSISPPPAGPATSSVTSQSAGPATNTVTSPPSFLSSTYRNSQPVTPAVTVPLDEFGRPSAIQPTDYRTTVASPTNLLPPISRIDQTKPNIVYSQLPPETPNGVPLAVRQRLNEVCTGKCRNLAVELASPMHLRVAFVVRDQVEADLLTNLLGTLTELAPYKVDFEVQIGQ